MSSRKKMLVQVPHPHIKASSTKTIGIIFLKLSDILPDNITVTNLH